MEIGVKDQRSILLILPMVGSYIENLVLTSA